MSEPLIMMARWEARREPRDRCAKRLAEFLSLLSSCDPALKEWRTRIDGEAPRPLGLSTEDLRTHFTPNRADASGTVIEELGYRIGMWTGSASKPEVGLDVLCGAFSKFVQNECVIELAPDEVTNRLAHQEPLRCLLNSVACAWSPQWAAVLSESDFERLNLDTRDPVAGWLTYLATPITSLPKLPRHVETQELCQGTLLHIDSSDLVGNQDEYVKRIGELTRIIRKAGGRSLTSRLFGTRRDR